jgi:hypothetical protein
MGVRIDGGLRMGYFDNHGRRISFLVEELESIPATLLFLVAIAPKIASVI